ncbi:hypothetical protein JW921_01615, partial [Candidatus Fermentibacterales bacterium]|nr:hypothetical protein [Candidatus Fermentibacterales bacterium]
ILEVLETALGFPVDIEFAYAGDIQTPYLLQCRPQSYGVSRSSVSIPTGVPQSDQLFTANRFVTDGLAEEIEYIVFVDPMEYDLLQGMEDLIEVGRAVGTLNKKLPARRFILMGPGRWGSRGDIKLGVRVGYSDINNTAVLVEMAFTKRGYVPELSFGTHFFQDLVEAGIKYLPLYPDDPSTFFNREFFTLSHNQLKRLIPEARHLEKVLKVIRVQREVPEANVSVVMNGEQDLAMGYIKRL